MTDINVKDQITVTVKTTESVEKEKEWTIETLDASIAQYNIDLEKIAKKRDDLVSIRAKALDLGIVHQKDVIPESAESKDEE